MRKKAGALVYRYSSDGTPELLVLTLSDHHKNYNYYRLPGGNLEEGETFYEGVLREIKEESGITDLIYMRSIGKVEFYKPYIKSIAYREDFLFYCNHNLPNVWDYEVEGDGNDSGEIFSYRWIKSNEFDKIDPELKTLLYFNNFPELYINNNNFGLERGYLALSEYCNFWPDIFEFEKYNILSTLSERIISIEHIGSTSISGMFAKPIIDIGIAVNSFEESFNIIKLLERIGYVYHGENGIKKRHYFTKGNPCFYHVHCLEIDSEEWKNHIKFKKVLNSDNELKQAYTVIKTNYIMSNNDRKGYQAMKNDLICKVLRDY